MYLTAAGTGFRANALANLTPSDLKLDNDSPTVTLAARFNKSRKTKIQPLPVDVAVALGGYLADRPENVVVWGGTWASDHCGAEMLRIDLEAAGVLYVVEGPDGPEYADFHSLRHSYLTLLGSVGVDLRTAQELAGHSTPTLTARYVHRRLHDLAGAMDKLPSLVPNCSENICPRICITDNSGAEEGDIPGHSSASFSTLEVAQSMSADVSQTQEKRPFGADLHQPASIDTKVSDGIRTRDVRNHNPVL